MHKYYNFFRKMYVRTTPGFHSWVNQILFFSSLLFCIVFLSKLSSIKALQKKNIYIYICILYEGLTNGYRVVIGSKTHRGKRTHCYTNNGCWVSQKIIEKNTKCNRNMEYCSKVRLNLPKQCKLGQFCVQRLIDS